MTFAPKESFSWVVVLIMLRTVLRVRLGSAYQPYKKKERPEMNGKMST